MSHAHRKSPHRRIGTGSYEVGYGRPPEQHRFQPGASGNPLGRPRRQQRPATLADLRRELSNAANLPIKLTIDGNAVTMTRLQAIAHRLMSELIKGNQPAFRNYFNLMSFFQRHGAELDRLVEDKKRIDLSSFTKEEREQFEVLLRKAEECPRIDDKQRYPAWPRRRPGS